MTSGPSDPLMIAAPPSGSGGGRTYWQAASDAWQRASPYVVHAAKEWPTWVMRRLKVAAHYGFLPLVIAVGMSYEPRPHILQLIGP